MQIPHLKTRKGINTIISTLNHKNCWRMEFTQGLIKTYLCMGHQRKDVEGTSSSQTGKCYLIQDLMFKRNSIFVRAEHSNTRNCIRRTMIKTAIYETQCYKAFNIIYTRVATHTPWMANLGAENSPLLLRLAIE